VVHGEGSSTFATDDPSAGLFARRDHRGVWAVESFWPPPTSNE
jgi:hypothetical protein